MRCSTFSRTLSVATAAFMATWCAAPNAARASDHAETLFIVSTDRHDDRISGLFAFTRGTAPRLFRQEGRA